MVDHNRKLIGFVSLKNLILSRRSATIEDIMQRDVIFGRVDEDQETVARQIDKYDLLALPIVDSTGRLVGIVTHDDAMDILRQEQTEDMLKFGGVSPDPEADTAPYWQSTVVSVFRRRIKWLLMLFLAENFTYPVLKTFEWTTDNNHVPALEFFLPLLLGHRRQRRQPDRGDGDPRPGAGRDQGPRRLARAAQEWLTGLLLGLMLGAVGILLRPLLSRPALGRLGRRRPGSPGHLHVGQYDRRPGAAGCPPPGHRPGRDLGPVHQHPGRCHRTGHLLHDRHPAAGADAMRDHTRARILSRSVDPAEARGEYPVEAWRILALSIGGVAGVNARYWLGVWINRWAGSQFPWATFCHQRLGVIRDRLPDRAAGPMVAALASPPHDPRRLPGRLHDVLDLRLRIRHAVATRRAGLQPGLHDGERRGGLRRRGARRRDRGIVQPTWMAACHETIDRVGVAASSPRRDSERTIFRVPRWIVHLAGNPSLADGPVRPRGPNP